MFRRSRIYDADGGKVIGTHHVPKMMAWEDTQPVMEDERPVMFLNGETRTVIRPVVSAEFGPAKDFTSREDRSEWNAVGLLGQPAVQKGQPVAPSWIRLGHLSETVDLWFVR